MDFIDLAAQQARIRDDLRTRMDAVLAHGKYILGPEVDALERALAAYVGVAHAVTISDGTTALQVALMALGVGPGDEVITSPFTFIASAEVIALVGATPVFVDIDPETYNLDPTQLASAITERTRAILPVSLFGQCAEIDEISMVAEGIPVIEDAAQSFGATHHGRRSGGLSTLGCTSFFPSKPLGCYGDGGACFTNDAELASRMRAIRAHGQRERYLHGVIGLNGRLDTLQAAVLLSKLTIFDDEVQKRATVAARYASLLQDVVKAPYVAPHNRSVYAQFTIELDARDRVAKALAAHGIPTAIHYPRPLHLQEAFASLGLPEGSFPFAERAASRVLSLPMHPYLSETDQTRVAEALIAAVREA